MGRNRRDERGKNIMMDDHIIKVHVRSENKILTRKSMFTAEKSLNRLMMHIQQTLTEAKNSISENAEDLKELSTQFKEDLV